MISFIFLLNSCADMEAVEVAALSLHTNSNICAPNGVKGHPLDPLLFIPIAITNFTPETPINHTTSTTDSGENSSFTFPSRRTERVARPTTAAISNNTIGCGWVMVISFESSGQLQKFIGSNRSSQFTNERQSSLKKLSSSPLTSEGKTVVDKQSLAALTPQEIAAWIAKSLRRWVKTIEIQFDVNKNQCLQEYSR